MGAAKLPGVLTEEASAAHWNAQPDSVSCPDKDRAIATDVIKAALGCQAVVEGQPCPCRYPRSAEHPEGFTSVVALQFITSSTVRSLVLPRSQLNAATPPAARQLSGPR